MIERSHNASAANSRDSTPFSDTVRLDDDVADLNSDCSDGTPQFSPSPSVISEVGENCEELTEDTLEKRDSECKYFSIVIAICMHTCMKVVKIMIVICYLYMYAHYSVAPFLSCI